MVKPTLLVLAAGMGSRYGSLKQMDGVGPNGEAIIDYSVYDAVRAGFFCLAFAFSYARQGQNTSRRAAESRTRAPACGFYLVCKGVRRGGAQYLLVCYIFLCFFCDAFFAFAA